ncbi:MAG: hypothetical protein WC332_01450 [Clostridia bacterium]|jgi:hypothetical protein
MQIFAHDGETGFEGIWTTITSARGFDSSLLNVPKDAKKWVRYTTGATAALVIGEVLTGGTSHETCRLIAKATENGTAGSSDSGIIFVNQVSGDFTSTGETLTGGTSTGTVATAENFMDILSYSPPKAALITVEIAAIKFALSGTLPTATAGTNYIHQMDAGQSYVIRGYNNIRKFKCINSVNGNGAIVKYSLFF